MYLYSFLLFIGGFIVLLLLLTGINVLQNGIGGWRGKTPEEIFGCISQDVTWHDFERLTKAQIMQVFFGAEIPNLQSLEGEFRAKLLSKGVLAAGTAVYTHKFFGPGKWLGKGFIELSAANQGRGYNLFGKDDMTDLNSINRVRHFQTYVGQSNIDQRNSFHLDYRLFNRGLVKSMHDEIRMISPNLFLGMGYMALGGGSINPAPFVLIGPPELPLKAIELAETLKHKE